MHDRFGPVQPSLKRACKEELMRLVPITGLLIVSMLGSDPASAATNVALASEGGVATANANTSTQALVNDGDAAAQGWVVPTTAATIKVDWGSVKPVNQVVAVFANANSKTFKFQYWNGSSWSDLSPTFTDNTETTVAYTPGSPVSTIAVRLDFSSAAASVYVNELQAFADSGHNPGTNVALASEGGVATANVNTSTQALVNDGNTAAQGWVVPTTAATIKVDWGSSKPVNQVTAIFENANSKTFKFQYWNGSSWSDLSGSYKNDTRTTVSYTPPSPVSTIAVRLDFSSAAASVYVNELQAFADSGSGVSRLTVVTWNLNKRSSSAAAQGDKLAAQAADLIFTQETAGASHANTIAAALGTGWEYHYHGTSSEGVAVFYKTSRLTVVEGEDFDVGPSSWGGVREGIRVKFMADGKTFSAFVTHFDWPSDGDWTDPNEEHVQNRNNFVTELNRFSGPKIWGGDFNSRYTGNAVQRGSITALDAVGVDSCFVRVTDPALDTDAKKQTYCDRNFPTVNSRLDHIYATSEFTQLNHDIVAYLGLSDHKLVIAEFDIQTLHLSNLGAAGGGSR
jgi:endonuclease/exonuclease/phosphatase (EEP) superfamily protein YafD